MLAMVLASAGRSVLMIDRHRHPRFAIGESSTPLADTALERIARNSNLSSIVPLARYGTWKEHTPELLCGKKRGFSYFSEFSGGGLPARLDRLLVAASSEDALADTHWLREHVDQFLCRQAEASGVRVIEQCGYRLEREGDFFRLHAENPAGDRIDCRIPFVVDATGSAGALLRILEIGDQTHRLRTRSSALFAHFVGVRRCAEMLRDAGEDVEQFPYDCDAAAVHILQPDGWMWQLRFDDDSVSAGFAVDRTKGPPPWESESSPEWLAQCWKERIARSPFLSRQFRDAEVVRPPNGLTGTRRLQRLASHAAGPNWACLPSTAGFIDPLHSTGIAHTLSGIERLSEILLRAGSDEDRSRYLHEYSNDVIQELLLIDQFVEGCYAALPDFELFGTWAMLYFAAVTSMEQQQGPESVPAPGFLRVNDAEFCAVLARARDALIATTANRSAEATHRFRNWLRQEIQPWNHVGLLNDSVDGLYHATAAQ